MRKICSCFRLQSFAALFALAFILSACQSTPGGYGTGPWVPKSQATGQAAQETPSDLSVASVEQFALDGSQIPIDENQNAIQNGNTIKVAILLPLSGQHEKLGEAMLNAAQMAFFDLGFNGLELLPKDTKGTPSGAQSAARAAINEGAQLVLGPVFSASVRAARDVTRSANVNMIAFSTDWTLANNDTYLIGFMPFDQVERVTTYAYSKGYNRIGLLSPNDNYGNAVNAAFDATAHHTGRPAAKKARFSTNGKDLGTVMRNFTNYDARKSQGEGAAPFDAVMISTGGTMARQVGSFLNHYDMPPKTTKRLGTGLLDDSTLATDRTLSGTWFAAPNPALRDKFERKYSMNYNARPPRIASLAYDATALSAILARIGLKNSGYPAFDDANITNPNGFSGVDGIFRFRRTGLSERGLAILEYRHGSIVMIDKAPRTFQYMNN